ncbi:MAG: RsmD family RNA methyltransferase [Prevotellaceae bacterium]|nr:RsmD family RNA methyltransferase [Prevotellaceae bacterium]
MRIITGIYKGLSFDVPKTFKARPTTDFAKENLFNVVRQYIDFDETTALDLFSGTGSISLELLSRGCQQVISVEADRDHHRFIMQCLQKINASNCVPIRGDVFRFLKSCKMNFDFIFADPPYKLEKLDTIPDEIFNRQLLKEGGLFVLEHGKEYDFSPNPHFAEHRSYGSVNFSFFR